MRGCPAAARKGGTIMTLLGWGAEVPQGGVACVLALRP
jgi:hypothetical protein